MSWTCINCGLYIPGDVMETVHCICEDSLDKQSGNHQQTNPEIYRRETVCETCSDYMDNWRCKSVDLGCRKTFKRTIRKGNCPRYKW